MVDFHPDYVRKHPELGVEARFKGFLTDLATLVTEMVHPGEFIHVSHWRKHWKTNDAKLRKELNAYVEAKLLIDGSLAATAKLSEVPGRTWTPIPPPTKCAGILLARLPATVVVALAVNPPCTLDPRPHISIEVRCRPFEGEVKP